MIVMKLKNVDENRFRQIYNHYYDFTHWDSQHWLITSFCNSDIIHNANNYNHEVVNTSHIK